MEMVFVVIKVNVYVMEGVHVAIQVKKTKQECDNVNGTWTFEIDGDDGSNGYWSGNNCEVCSSNNNDITLYYGNSCKVYCNNDSTNGNYLSCNNGECDEVTGECVCNEDTNTGYFTKSVNSIEETCDLCKRANYHDTYCNTIDNSNCDSDDKCELINGTCVGLQIYYPQPSCSDGTSTSKDECDLANETWSYPENSCKTLCIKDTTCIFNTQCFTTIFRIKTCFIN